MDTQKGFIKYFVIIVVILVVAFFSQQAYSRAVGKPLISAASNQIGQYLAKGSDWVTTNVLSKITGEVQSRGDTITAAVNQEKNKVSENIGKQIENYFSGVAKSITSPGTPQNCPTPPSQTVPAK